MINNLTPRPITLELSELEARSVRDAISCKIRDEQSYQEKLRTVHGKKYPNLHAMSKQQEAALSELRDKFHKVYILTRWNEKV